MSHVLVTGGAGYIGTHALFVLAPAGQQRVSIDNYSNSSPGAIERVLRIAPYAVEVLEGDVRDTMGIARLLAGPDVDSVITSSRRSGCNDREWRPS
jgi:UDP-glucose 4-epimerase